jgi:hypothetical protein
MNADENNQIKLTNNNANDEEPARSRLSSANRVMDINKTGDSNPAFLPAHNNELYFGGSGGSRAGQELRKLNNTTG